MLSIKLYHRVKKSHSFLHYQYWKYSILKQKKLNVVMQRKYIQKERDNAKRLITYLLFAYLYSTTQRCYVHVTNN